VPDDQGHAADSGTGRPRRGRASRRRLSGRGDSPTSRNATTEPASVVQCVPAAKKVARSRRAPQRSGPRPGAYPAPSSFVGARYAIAASIVILFPPRGAYPSSPGRLPKARLSKPNPLGVPRTRSHPWIEPTWRQNRVFGNPHASKS
jgi:hypothetical protein